jgi:hypothetical protein
MDDRTHDPPELRQKDLQNGQQVQSPDNDGDKEVYVGARIMVIVDSCPLCYEARTAVRCRSGRDAERGVCVHYHCYQKTEIGLWLEIYSKSDVEIR